MFKPMATTTTTGGPMATTTTTGGEATHVHVQSLPCNIKYDGPADVSGRLIVKQHADGGLETAFRGRELRGVDAPLRKGTTGLVVDTGDGTARVRGTFDRIRVWEYDAPPGPSNSVMDALAKVDALTALHALED